MTNDETMAKAAVTVLTPAFGKRLAFAPASATPMSGSEDFSEYVDAGVPSLFFGIGGYDPAVLDDLKAKCEPAPTNHSPFFAPKAAPAIRSAVTASVLSNLGGLRAAAKQAPAL